MFLFCKSTQKNAENPHNSNGILIFSVKFAALKTVKSKFQIHEKFYYLQAISHPECDSLDYMRSFYGPG